MTTRRLIIGEILWRPSVLAVVIIYGALQLVSNAIAWTLSPEDQARYQFIKLIGWREWLVGTSLLTILLVGLIGRAAIQAIEKREIQLDALETSKLTPDQTRDLIGLVSEGDGILRAARSRQVDVREDFNRWETQAAEFLRDSLGLQHEAMFVHAIVEPADISGAGIAHRTLVGRIQARLSVLHRINDEQRRHA